MYQFISPFYVGIVYDSVYYGNRVGSLSFFQRPLFNLLSTSSMCDDVEDVRKDKLVSS